MRTHCPQCTKTPNGTPVDCCDFCTHFDFNGDKDGSYTGNGWCRYHKEQRDPGSDCDFFCCENAAPLMPDIRTASDSE